MPRVPVYERQVAPQPAPMVRYDTDVAQATLQGGLALAAGTRRISDIGTKIAIEERELADAERVTAAAADTSALELDLDRKYTSLKGEQAIGIGPQAEAEWTAGLKKIREGLATERQRMAFDRIAMSRTGAFRKSILTHEDAQMTAVDEEKTKATVTNAIELASRATDEKSFNDAVNLALGASNAFLDRYGRPKEVKEKAAQAINSDAFSARAREIARTSPVEAMEFVEKNRDKLTEQAYSELSGKFQRQSDEVKVAGFTDQIVAESTVNGVFDYAKAQALAKEKLAGNPLRNDVEDSLATIDVRQRSAKTAVLSNAMQEAMGQMLRGGIDRDWLNQLPDDVELQVRDWEKTYNKQRRAEYEDSDTYKTNQAILWTQFVDEASTPGANVQELIVRYAKRGLDPDKLMQAPTLQRRGDKDGEVKYTELFSDEANIKMWLVEAGVVDATKKVEHWTKDQLHTQIYVSQKLQEYVTANQAMGQKVSPTDKKQFVLDLLAPIAFREGGWSGTKEYRKPAPLVTEEQRKRAFIPKGESTKREELAAYAILRKRGVNKPSTAEVEEMVWDMRTGDDIDAFIDYRADVIDALIRKQGAALTPENRAKVASWLVQSGWKPENER